MKFRDITILPITPDLYMAISCDVSASIGEKPDDVLCVSTKMTGAYCARVALMELLALGAKPQALIHTVGNEFNPTGKLSLEGIREELSRAGYNHIEINGSSEENMDTSMTAIGVTLLGSIRKDSFKVRCQAVEKGDSLYVVGSPLVGRAVIERPRDIVPYEAVSAMVHSSCVRDVLPVGSRGISGEMDTLLMGTSLRCHYLPEWEHSAMLTQSGGPATSVLVVVYQGQDDQFKAEMQSIYPMVRKLGTLSVEE